MKPSLALGLLSLVLCACNSGGGDAPVANPVVSTAGAAANSASGIVAEPWPLRAGEPARLSVAGAPAGASYRWRIGNTPVPGSGNSVPATFQLGDNLADISVEISNPDGSRQVRSLPATVVYPVGIGFVAGDVSQAAYVDGDGVNARFVAPRALEIDPKGNIYVSDDGMIRRISAGKGSTHVGQYGDYRVVDGTRAEARLNRPWHMAFDDSGNLLVTEGDTLRLVASDGQVRTLAGQHDGTGAVPGPGQAIDGDRQQARLAALAGVCAANGKVYLSDYPNTANPLLRSVDAAGGITTLLANWLPQTAFTASAVPRVRYRPLDGISIAINVNAHVDAFEWIDQEANLALACSTTGEQYLLDQTNHVIRKVDSKRQVSVFTGQPGIQGDANGGRTQALLDRVADMTFAVDGNLYIAEPAKQRIRRVRPDGSIEAFVGGVAGTPATAASLNAPIGSPTALRVDPSGKVLYFISGAAVMYASLP